MATCADRCRGNAGLATRADRYTYDNELLDAHYIAGDGRVNENIGLTAVHHVFHSEHNRLVEQTKDVVLDDAATSPSSTSGCCDRSRAASDRPQARDRRARTGTASGCSRPRKFGTEMQYQHLVFEEFARTIQPHDRRVRRPERLRRRHQSGDRRRVRPHRLPLRPLDADRDDRPLRSELQRDGQIDRSDGTRSDRRLPQPARVRGQRRRRRRRRPAPSSAA